MLRAALILALPLLALATPHVARQSSGSCPGSSPVQCCENVYQPNSSEGKALLKAANLHNDARAQAGMVATGCNTGLGLLDGSICAANPVCCNANPGSVITVGCLPVIL